MSSQASRFSNWRDVAAVLVRRKWWIFIPATLLTTVALLAALLLPPVYVSESLILIKPKEVPSDIVRDLVGDDSDRRLSAIRESVLSRKSLEEIYRVFGDQLSGLDGLNREQRLETIRDRIGIDFERPDRRSPIHYFRISFEDQVPEAAQRVTNELLKQFQQAERKNREDQVYGTEEFLDEEYNKVKEALQIADANLAQLKGRYQYELPENLDANLRTLDRLVDERRANAEKRDRLLSEKLNVERLLSETAPVIVEEVSSSSTPAAKRQVSPLVQAYRLKEQHYQDLIATYTDRHPDVVRARKELDQLRAQIPAEDLLEIEEQKAGVETRSIPNPVYQRLLGQQQEVKTEIGIQERDLEDIQKQIDVYSKRVSNTPAREIEVAAAQREYDELKARADDLKSKLSDTQLAVNLETRAKGEEFNIVDSGSLPLVPSKPKRELIAILGLLGSLALGVGFAFARDIIDARFWTHHEVERFFDRPLLIEIPKIMAPVEMRRARQAERAKLAMFLLLVATCGATVVGVYQTPKLRDWGTQKLARVTTLLSVKL